MTDKKHKKESDKKRRTQDISIDSTYSISAFLKKQKKKKKKKKKKKTDDDQNDDGTRSARLDDEDDVRRAIRESTRTPRVEQEDDVECIFFIPRDDVVDDDCTTTTTTTTTTKQKKQNGRGDESRGRCRGYFRGRTKARPHDGGLRATRNHLALDVGKISPGGRFQRRPSVVRDDWYVRRFTAFVVRFRGVFFLLTRDGSFCDHAHLRFPDFINRFRVEIRRVVAARMRVVRRRGERERRTIDRGVDAVEK